MYVRSRLLNDCTIFIKAKWLSRKLVNWTWYALTADCLVYVASG